MKTRNSIVGVPALVGVMIGIASVASFNLHGSSLSYDDSRDLNQLFQSRTGEQVGRRIKPATSPLLMPLTDPSMNGRAAADEDLSGLSLGCLIRLSILNELRDDVLSVVPATNLLTYNNVISVFDQHAADCELLLETQLQDVEEVMEDIEDIPVRPSALDCLEPGYCNMFSKKRRTMCEGAQQEGLCYQAGQYGHARGRY